MRGNRCCVLQGQIVNAKTYSSLYKLNFGLVNTISSDFFQTLLPPKVTFTSSKTYFSTNPGGNLFSVQWKQYAFFGSFFLLLETTIKIKGINFKRKIVFLLNKTIIDFFARRSSFSVQWKCIFQQMFHSGQWKLIFWQVQTISCFSVQWKRIVFNESFIPAIGEVFSLYWKLSTLLESSFLLMENIFSIVSDIFQEVFHPGKWKHIFQSRKKVLFFTQKFFPASRNHYLNYRQSYLKLLSLLLIFQTFLPM